MKYTSQLLFFLLLFSLGAYSQSNLPALVNSFNQQDTGLTKEKIYVHTDKSFYVAGELLWFKVYAVDADLHKPLNLSKVAYIELLDTANKPVMHAKVALSSGYGNGSFYLPITIASGNYKLRAYTNWMKNFGAADFFEKRISIVNVQKLSVSTNKNAGYQYVVQFFPEGGNLVNGIKSRVAFKATDQQGKGFSFRGSLMDNEDTLLSFKPGQSGIGSFYFTPIKGHIYKAYIQPETGAASLIALPLIATSGYTIQLQDTNDSTFAVAVESNIESAGEVYLVVHAQGKIKAASKGVLQNGKTVFTINQKVLPDGISDITLFDVRKQPVCERLYFKKPSRSLQLAVSSEKAVYDTRKNVMIAIRTNNTNNTNDSASLSMAVYRLDSLQSLDESTIDNYFLLTSGLKGTVENPAYYLSNDSNAKSAADNLMLVNGWRKFKQNEPLDNAKPLLTFAPEYRSHIITGKVVNIHSGNSQSNVAAFLSVPGTRTQFYPAVSDTSGSVKFETHNFYGSSKIIVQTNDEQDSSYRINIDDPFSQAFSATTIPSFALPEKSPNTLLQHSISMQVQSIYAGDKLNQLHFFPGDTSTFYLHADKKYLLDDYTRFTTLEEVLREYVELVNVTKREGRYHFPVYDFGTKTVFKNDPLVLVDGVPIFDLNRFISYDPLKMKNLEVVNKRYFLGSVAFDGILNWQTYSGDLANFDLDPHALILDYEGLQMQREFYAPAYETAEAAESHLPDFRNLLYWNPSVKIKGDGTQQIHFYTSDLPGKYAVVVQGIAASGLCGSGVITFDVKNKTD